MSEDPRAHIPGGRRCAVYRDGDWWVGVSPRNGEGASVEGPWQDWVELARNILAADEMWRAMNTKDARDE